jgi:phosphoglycolate phosphatase-like HAD superfamily hydrolase
MHLIWDWNGTLFDDLLRRHLAELSMNGDHKVVMVGDTFDDAAAAGKAGLGCVFYDGGSHHRHELEATGIPVADILVQAIDLAAAL